MLPESWQGRLRVPAIAAPMTDVSGPGLVAAACAAGVIGAFPAHNAESPAQLGLWLAQIAEQAAGLAPDGARPAPVAVNLIVHPSNARLEDDLRAVARGGAEVVITSVGSPHAVAGPLRDAGIAVLADVASLRHARRAIEAGVDGLVLLTAGAGGQTGWANPFAFLRAVRARYDGVVVLAGGVSDGAGILAAQVLGADLAYLGTRFVATEESLAGDDYRAALVAASLDDVTTSTQVSGLAANVLTAWLDQDGAPAAPDGRPFTVDRLLARRGVWAAGHSADGVTDVLPVAALVRRLADDLEQARAAAGLPPQNTVPAGASGARR